jgi:hypothetical protein
MPEKRMTQTKPLFPLGDELSGLCGATALRVLWLACIFIGFKFGHAICCVFCVLYLREPRSLRLNVFVCCL